MSNNAGVVIAIVTIVILRSLKDPVGIENRNRKFCQKQRCCVVIVVIEIVRLESESFPFLTIEITTLIIWYKHSFNVIVSGVTDSEKERMAV